MVRFLGPGSQRIVLSGDPVSDRRTRERFVQLYDEASRLESVTEAEAVLHLGKDDWPLPIPLVKDAKGVATRTLYSPPPQRYCQAIPRAQKSLSVRL